MNFKEKYLLHFDQNQDHFNVFQYPTYLQSVSNGNWNVLGYVENNEIIILMPYVEEVTIKGKILKMPPLCQYLGPVWVTTPTGSKSSILAKQNVAIGALLKNILAYDYVSYSFSTENLNPIPFHAAGLKPISMVSYEQKNLNSIEDGFKVLASNKRRTIKKIKDYEIHRKVKVDEFIHFFTSTLNSRSDRPRYSVTMLKKLMNAGISEGFGKIFAISEKGKLAAAVFVVHDTRRAYHLVTPYHATASRGMLDLLTLHIMVEFNRKGLIYDFEGSISPGLERVYREFGANQVFYNHISQGLSWKGKLAELFKK